jgi:hypothetical protein
MKKSLIPQNKKQLTSLNEKDKSLTILKLVRADSRPTPLQPNQSHWVETVNDMDDNK